MLTTDSPNFQMIAHNMSLLWLAMKVNLFSLVCLFVLINAILHITAHCKKEKQN